jgi:hypothetical protein
MIVGRLNDNLLSVFVFLLLSFLVVEKFNKKLFGHILDIWGYKTKGNWTGLDIFRGFLKKKKGYRKL